MREKTENNLPPLPLLESLSLKPINLDRDSDLCVKIREDSFIQSYGSAEKFLGADGRGEERYLHWLLNKMTTRPGSCCHLWLNDEIVGQLEVGRTSEDPTVGWIYLVYIVSSKRRQGLGAYLLARGEDLLRQDGLRSAGLRVGRSNSAAITLYSRNGWRFEDHQVDQDESLVMRKDL